MPTKPKPSASNSPSKPATRAKPSEATAGDGAKASSSKRLFEEIDEATDKNLFAFLDKKKPAPTGARPVFKTCTSLQRKTAPARVSTSPRVRRRPPTSIKDQANEPLRKKPRPVSPLSPPKRISKKLASRPATSLKKPSIRKTHTPPHARSPAKPSQHSNKSIKDSSEAPAPVEESLPDRAALPNKPCLPAPGPAHARLRNQPSSSSTPPRPSLARTLFAPQLHSSASQRPSSPPQPPALASHPLTPQSDHERRAPSKKPPAFAGTSISPVPVIIKRKDSDGRSVDGDSSTDTIDFLSPKKHKRLDEFGCRSADFLGPLSDNPMSHHAVFPTPNMASAAGPASLTESASDSQALSTRSHPYPLPIQTPDEAELPVSPAASPPAETVTTTPQSSPPDQVSKSSSASTTPPPSFTDLMPLESPESHGPTLASAPCLPNPKSLPGSRTVQPIRNSPIKQPTMPTSIPISSSAVPYPPRNPFGPTSSSASTDLLSLPERPSKLPRRQTKPTTSLASHPQPLSSIIENSPVKPIPRDALGTGSLKLHRGANVPDKVIFTGGIKAKADEFLSRQRERLSRSALSRSQEPPRNESTSGCGTAIQAQEVPQEHETLTPALDSSSATQVQVEEESAGDAEESSFSTADQSLASSTSSSTASTLSANISQDIQDKLKNLQGMLERMNGSDHHQRPGGGSGGEYEEYEVPVKTGEEHQEKDPTAPQVRTLRRRSVSVGAPCNTANRLRNRASGAGSNKSTKTARRESNILPSGSLHQGMLLTSAEDRLRKVLPLKDVVALVDVRTAEGDEAGKVFVEMLQGLGAKVVLRPTTVPLTHIVFKAGKQLTIDKYLAYPHPKPFLVGIGWVVRCREILSRASETPYLIDSSTSHVSASPTFNDQSHQSFVGKQLPQPRLGYSTGSGGLVGTGGTGRGRKSMEPKALALWGQGHHGLVGASGGNRIRNDLSSSCAARSDSADTSASSTELEHQDKTKNDRIALSINNARRKSLQFLPKVGSPLARRSFRPNEDEDEEKEGRQEKAPEEGKEKNKQEEQKEGTGQEEEEHEEEKEAKRSKDEQEEEKPGQGQEDKDEKKEEEKEKEG